MNLQVVKAAVSSKIGRQILVAQKHSPTIMFGAGVAGAVTATVFACKATLKLEDLLDEAEEMKAKIQSAEHASYSEKDRQRDLAKLKVQTAGNLARLYAPSIVIGTVSIGLLTKSHRTLTQRNAALMAAYAALDEGFGNYRSRVRDEYGREKDEEFLYGTETVKETVEKKDGSKKTVEKKVLSPTGGSIYSRFFDEFNQNWKSEPQLNRIFLSIQQTWANDLLMSRGHIFLNEVYDMLGMDRSPEGSIVGWVKGGAGDGFVDFGIFDGDDWRKREFVNGREHSILLDFNVDGVIWDKI